MKAEMRDYSMETTGWAQVASKRWRAFAQRMERAFTGWMRHDATGLSAALAFYSVISLPPFVVISISMAAKVFGDDAARGAISRELEGVIGSGPAVAIETVIDSARNSQSGGLMAVVGFITLLVTAGAVFIQMKEALNRIWEVEWKSGAGVMNYFRDRFVSMAMVVGSGFLMIISLIGSTAVSSLVSYVGETLIITPVLLEIANLLLSVGLFTFVFTLIFRVLPEAPVKWKDAAGGALVTSILFSSGKSLLAAYLAREGVASAYGATGALMLLLLWVYYSSLIVLFGAEFTAARKKAD